MVPNRKKPASGRRWSGTPFRTATIQQKTPSRLTGSKDAGTARLQRVRSMSQRSWTKDHRQHNQGRLVGPAMCWWFVRSSTQNRPVSKAADATSLAPNAALSLQCSMCLLGEPAVSVTIDLGRITHLSIGPKVRSAVAHHVNCELADKHQKNRRIQHSAAKKARNKDSATFTCPWNFGSQTKWTRLCSLVSEQSGPISPFQSPRKGKFLAHYDARFETGLLFRRAATDRAHDHDLRQSQKPDSDPACRPIRPGQKSAGFTSR
jgi:hypothetical protein